MSKKCYVHLEGQQNGASLFDFVKTEIHRGYVLENDEERYGARREKMYSLMRVPKEVEKFMLYGFLQCFDSFLFVCVFLPYRFLLALWSLFVRSSLYCLGIKKKSYRSFLSPPEICDILKSFLLITCTIAFLKIDMNVIYHIIKFQSVIKLYIIFNILEVGDRLLSCLGQDTIDALFWTATEPKDRRKNRFGLATHLLLAGIYVCMFNRPKIKSAINIAILRVFTLVLHSLLVLFQATTLNVAINSENKALSIIMMSNNFVELKGSVFKKFDKNNLFQVSCCDVRERFHLFMLIQIVILQTMKEYSWQYDRFWVLLPDCISIILVEVAVDWIKHAFITRFNDLQVSDIYKEYTVSLAYDMAQIRQKHAFTDQTDLVSRRMGFMPIPIVVCFLRVMYHCFRIDTFISVALVAYGFLVLFTFKMLVNILVLGRACDLIDHFESENTKIAPKTTPADSLKDMATSPLKMSSSITVKEIDIKSEIDNKKMNEVKHTDLNSTPIFSNSSVDLKTACLNDEVLRVTKEDLSKDVKKEPEDDVKSAIFDVKKIEDVFKRSESDPGLKVGFKKE